MDTLKITGSVGSKNRTKFNHLKLYNKNIFEFSLDKKNIGCPHIPIFLRKRMIISPFNSNAYLSMATAAIEKCKILV